MKKYQELNSLALKVRRMVNEDGYSPIDIFALINGWMDRKISVIKYPLSSRISGMCTIEGEDIVICINSNSTSGRQRFTLAHELYHVLFENGKQQVICDMSMDDSKSEDEREADIFASYLLMPYDALIQYQEEHGEWSLANVIAAEQFFQISHQAMLYRLGFEGLLDKVTIEKYKGITVSKEAARLGFSKDLYFSPDKNRKYFTTGEYIRKVETLAEKEMISNSKREELLMDAYRADIVYDFNEGEDFIDD